MSLELHIFTKGPEMKKSALILVSFIFIFGNSFAAAPKGETNFFDRGEDLNIPDELEVLSGGFPEAPVVSCPRPSEKYANLLNQLTDIKNNIKEDACPESEVVVADLESLVGSKRKEFLGIISQGVFGKGQLNKDQVKKVEDYVQSIVEKAASVTGLLENKACFRDGDNQSALGYVSSVISEVSGAVGALAGPFGAKFALGGKIAGALVGSVNKIVTARQTYVYTKWDKTLKRQVVNMKDINGYFNNLCTYHDFKGDLDVESDLVDPRNRYDNVFAVTEEYLQNIGSICGSCSDFITQYELVEKQGYIDLTNPARIESESPGTDEVGSEPDRRGGDGVQQTALSLKDLSEVSDDDLLRFAQIVSGEAIREQAESEEARQAAIDEMLADGMGEMMLAEPEPIVQAPVVVEEAGEGNYEWAQYRLPNTLTDGPVHWNPEWELSDLKATIRALLIRSWIRKEVVNLELTIRDGNGRPGRSGVRDEQQRIEDFLIEDEAVSFIDMLVEKFEGKSGFTGFEGSFEALVNAAEKAKAQIENLQHGYLDPIFEALDSDPSFDPKELESDGASKDVAVIVHAFHELFRPDLDFDSVIDDAFDVISGGSSTDRIEDLVDQFIDERENAKEALESAFAIAVDDYFMIRDRCMFFKKSHFANNRKLRRACIKAGRKIQKMYDLASLLEYSAYEYRGGFIVGIITDEHNENRRPNYVRDFLGSVEYAMKKDLIDLERKIAWLEEENQELLEFQESKAEKPTRIPHRDEVDGESSDEVIIIDPED